MENQMATLEIRDERPELSPRLVARHENVRDISPAQLIAFHGVALHLRAVLIHEDGTRQIIQEGRR
jgi:hypothetical protein